MAHRLDAPDLFVLRRELADVIGQIEYHENGHADWHIENAIYAAHKRSETTNKLRERASSLRALIAAYEDASA
jgi:hypothetical protein